MVEATIDLQAIVSLPRALLIALLQGEEVETPRSPLTGQGSEAVAPELAALPEFPPIHIV